MILDKLLNRQEPSSELFSDDEKENTFRLVEIMNKYHLTLEEMNHIIMEVSASVESRTEQVDGWDIIKSYAAVYNAGKIDAIRLRKK